MHHGKHEADHAAAATGRPESTFAAELRQTASPRTLLLIAGVLFLQIAFIFSYVGAFHSPSPHEITVSVAAGPRTGQVVAQLNGLHGRPLRASAAPTADAAKQRVVTGDSSAALVMSADSTQDTLYVAGGGGSSTVTAVEATIAQVESAQHRSAHSVDLVPLQAHDARGLTGFYVVIGWIVGGYLVAAAIGILGSPRPRGLGAAAGRLTSLLPYALLSGLLGTLVVDQLLGALTGHFWALWGVGTLLVLASAAVTVAMEALFGIVGIGVTILVFVVLGNPSAGGAYQADVLPGFWRVIGPLIPNGAGTSAVRNIVYFGGRHLTGSLLCLVVYIAVGILGTLGATWWFNRAEPAAAPAPAEEPSS
ncbi:ABC-2 transporter permease [Flexivirga lutea]